MFFVITSTSDGFSLGTLVPFFFLPNSLSSSKSVSKPKSISISVETFWKHFVSSGIFSPSVSEYALFYLTFKIDNSSWNAVVV